MTSRGHAGAVILAAGRSTRMGEPKTALPLAGRSLLEHVVDAALAAGLAEVVVVLREGDAEAARALAARGDARLRSVSGEASRDGLSGSLALGLAALSDDCERAAVLLGDQPGVGAGLIAQVLAAAASERERALRPVFVGGGARVPGHPVVLPRALFRLAAAGGGDAGARALFDEHPERLSELELDTAAPADVDTPADYARLLAEHDGAH